MDNITSSQIIRRKQGPPSGADPEELLEYEVEKEDVFKVLYSDRTTNLSDGFIKVPEKLVICVPF